MEPFLIPKQVGRLPLTSAGSPLAPPTPPPSPLLTLKCLQEETASDGVHMETDETDHVKEDLFNPTPDLIKSAAQALEQTDIVGERQRKDQDSGHGLGPSTHPSDLAFPGETSSTSHGTSGGHRNEAGTQTIDSKGGQGSGSPGKGTTSRPSSARESPEYQLKWIKWKGNKSPILTQNENGPCPLIAIINVLILKGRLRLPSMIEIITANQLMEYLGDCILGSLPKGVSEAVQLNFEQNMQDAIAILPKLQTGLDVNVRFTSISDFEFTPELIVFDLLHIPLYHGWLIDPEGVEVQAAIGNCSYNQLVDKIITNKTSPKPEFVTEALIGEHFLEKTASQLTYHGLSELVNNIKEEELSVLFRNNHFITVFKHKKELFQLVTDQGFLTEPNVVWETLNNIEGDGQFIDGDFVTVPPKAALALDPVETQTQVDQDYLIALSLQEENTKEAEQAKEWEQFKMDAGMEGLDDEELARRLQLQEDKRHASIAAKEAALKKDKQQPQGHHRVQTSHPPTQPASVPQQEPLLQQQPSRRSPSNGSPGRKSNSDQSPDGPDPGKGGGGGGGGGKSNKNCSVM